MCIISDELISSKLKQTKDLMKKIVEVEEEIERQYPRQNIKTPVHLCIGQEIVPAMISPYLTDKDYIVSNHRSHGHAIAKGIDINAFWYELYGNDKGCCNGKGGSMHMADMSKGIIPTSAIVGAGLAIACGTAYSQKLDGNGHVTVCYFGDGAVDEGIFWESVNFAILHKLPILFAYEDNHVGSGTTKPYRRHFSSEEAIDAMFGGQYLKFLKDDDIHWTSGWMNIAIDGLRKGCGPYLARFDVDRLCPHVGPREVK